MKQEKTNTEMKRNQQLEMKKKLFKKSNFWRVFIDFLVEQHAIKRLTLHSFSKLRLESTRIFLC